MKRVIGRHKAFLAAFKRCASITVAAKSARIDRGQHYEWLRTRPGYADEFAAAVDEAAQLLEDEAVRRAYKGVFEPNVYQGQFVYPVKKSIDPDGNKVVTQGKKPLGVLKHSDTLLMFLLKGLKPEKFRDRVSAEVTGKDGGPISLEAKRLATLTDDELTALLATAQKLALVGDDRGGTTPEKAK